MRGILGQQQRTIVKQAKKMMRSSNLAMHVGSVAIGLESLEQLLVERGVLKQDELMERIQKITREHYAKEEFLPELND